MWKLFSHLYKNSEEDYYNGCCDEESFLWEVINQEDQGETDSSSQATIGNDELISEGHSISSELVYHSSQKQNTLRRKVCGILQFDNWQGPGQGAMVDVKNQLV